MLELIRTQRWSVTLALLAMAVTAAFCVIGHIQLATSLWRCLVAFAGVWVYQRLLVELWTALEPEPIIIRVSRDHRPRR